MLEKHEKRCDTSSKGCARTPDAQHRFTLSRFPSLACKFAMEKERSRINSSHLKPSKTLMPDDDGSDSTVGSSGWQNHYGSEIPLISNMENISHNMTNLWDPIPQAVNSPVLRSKAPSWNLDDGDQWKRNKDLSRIYGKSGTCSRSSGTTTPVNNGITLRKSGMKLYGVFPLSGSLFASRKLRDIGEWSVRQPSSSM